MHSKHIFANKYGGLVYDCRLPLHISNHLSFSTCADAVMKFDVTEDFIRMTASEHLKHAPQKSGGGGHAEGLIIHCGESFVHCLSCF